VRETLRGSVKDEKYAGTNSKRREKSENGGKSEESGIGKEIRVFFW